MCTVTFVPAPNGAILTSNRDEDAARVQVTPEIVELQNKRLWFPKDPRGGGSWFAATSRPAVIILLNGAHEKHEWNPPYRKSRGLVVLELAAADAIIEAWQAIDLNDIEPFTLVVYERGLLYQLRWDGHEKEVEHRDASKPHIWSSTMLYPKEIRAQREIWFTQFLKQHQQPSAEALYRFHRGTHPEDQENGLVIARYGFLQTLSITQAVVGTNLQLRHRDLSGEQQTFTQTLSW